MDNRAGSRLIGAAARLYHGARAPRALARLVRRAGPAALTVHASRPLAAHSNGRRRSSERARRGLARRSARGGWVIGRIPLRFLYGPTRFARTGAAKARPSSWSGRRGSFAKAVRHAVGRSSEHTERPADDVHEIGLPPNPKGGNGSLHKHSPHTLIHTALHTLVHTDCAQHSLPTAPQLRPRSLGAPSHLFPSRSSLAPLPSARLASAWSPLSLLKCCLSACLPQYHLHQTFSAPSTNS